jgi:glutamate/tyrosine decarboxylase-like PLP-dependent enzyme
MYWPKLSTEEIRIRVMDALKKNISYRESAILGLPATCLDEKIFYEGEPFLKDAPFLSSLVANPNHIGCHTMEHEGEPFSGTQELEKQVISICSEQILDGTPGCQDGYIASGGTEANIQALWIYRNYFRDIYRAHSSQVGVVYSEDTHYSIPKAIDLLGLVPVKIGVSPATRSMSMHDLERQVQHATAHGVRFFIAVMNLSTTMFGSVDDIGAATALIARQGHPFKVHVDAAFGGFIYPFTRPSAAYSFRNPHISSFTIDGHKLLQTPYGTGIFLVRKGYMEHVCTSEASYVKGTDYTLCGSRSGANAVAVWMVLHAHGSDGWTEKMKGLVARTEDLSARLQAMQIKHYHHEGLNIIAIDARFIPASIAEKFYLVPDRQHAPRWWKIVVMPHIRETVITSFLAELNACTTNKKHHAH